MNACFIQLNSKKKISLFFFFLTLLFMIEKYLCAVNVYAVYVCTRTVDTLRNPFTFVLLCDHEVN